jgi:hypothetical protein
MDNGLCSHHQAKEVRRRESERLKRRSHREGLAVRACEGVDDVALTPGVLARALKRISDEEQ